jgi:hypothetical protein
MEDHSKKTEQFDADDRREPSTVRECVDNDTPDRSTNPKVGEDPGLLPMNEDPRERAMKRNTM